MIKMADGYLAFWHLFIRHLIVKVKTVIIALPPTVLFVRENVNNLGQILY